MGMAARIESARAQTTTLLTTANGLGSFTGDRLPNLQQANLEPREYTLQFQVMPPVDGLGYATYAYVNWKVAGQQIQRILSVYSGSAISGLADAVDVSLQDQSNRNLLVTPFATTFTVTNGSPDILSAAPVTIANGEQITFSVEPGVFYEVPNGMNGFTASLDRPFTGPTSVIAVATAFTGYQVGVTLSAGTRPTTMQPPVLFTQRMVRVAANNVSPQFFIPADAGIISCLVSAVVVPGSNQLEAEHGYVEFFAANGLTIIAEYIPNEFNGWYPIPPGANSYAFANSSTVDAMFFSLQWGIEG